MSDANIPYSDEHLGNPHLRKLGWIGLAMILVYGIFIVFYGDDPQHQSRIAREIFIWPAITTLLLLYWLGYRQLRQVTSPPVRLIIIFGGFIGLVALLVTPFHSTDLFGYINRGWQQLAYGLNPYVHVVKSIPHWKQDPMITDHWVGNPSPYGFLFVLIAKALCFPAAGNFTVTVFVFKLFNLLVHLGLGGLIYYGGRKLSLPRPDLGLYLYLWNPLILLHHLSNGHNDIMMGFFIVLSAILIISRSEFTRLWAIPALMAGTLIKYAAVILLPLALIHVLRQDGWKNGLIGSLLGLGLLVLFSLPFATELAQVPLDKITSNATITHSSLHSALYSLYKEVTNLLPVLHDSRPLIRAILKYTLWAAFGAFYIFQLRLAWREPVSRESFITRALLIMFAAICVASPKFYPWYAGMFFPLALLLPTGSGLREFMVIFTGFQLYAFTLLGQAHILNWTLLTGLPLLGALWIHDRPHTRSFLFSHLTRPSRGPKPETQSG